MTPAHINPALSRESLLARRPLSCYFALAFGISWLGAFALVAPHLARGEAVPKFAGLMMFPIMLVGPSLGGILMTSKLDGRRGLRDLFSRMARVAVPRIWYAALLIPPALILLVLVLLKMFVSPVFSPNRFFMGAFFGVVAGLFEEIGWMGFAFPRMARQQNAFAASLGLGILWAAWHLPAIDYLGTATPHGAYWFRYFLAFAAAMTAMRVLIAWIYANTGSVAMCQLMHASSTGALVVFSPAHITAAEEAFWYAAYSFVLWVVVLIVIRKSGTTLGQLRFSRAEGETARKGPAKI